MTTEIILLVVGGFAFLAMCGLLGIGESSSTTSSTTNSAATDQAQNVQTIANKSNVASPGGVLLQNSNITSPDSVLLQGNAKLFVRNEGIGSDALSALAGQFIDANQAQAEAFAGLIASAQAASTTSANEPEPAPVASEPETEPATNWKISGGVAAVVVALLVWLLWPRKGK